MKSLTVWLTRLVMMVLLGSAGVALAADTGSTGYVLGPDDAVQIIVYGQTDASVSTRIKSDGTIVMPLIGTIQVAGTTNITLAKLITEKLSSAGFFKSPIVNVEVAGYVSKSVNVAGRVTTPGIYPLDRPYRALDILLKAGWIRENGASYVYLRRLGSAEIRLESEGLVRGGPDKDPVLQPGDTLFVPDADNFFIYGQINRPGTFPVLQGMTIRQAMAIAGGVTPTGSANKVGLIRAGGKEVDADLSQQIQKNDVIVVKERLF